MKVTTQIGDRSNFVMTRAILVYEEQIHKHEAFATLHEVMHARSGAQPPTLGPGRLLNTAFLRTLSQGLDRTTKTVLLPENILAYTSQLVIWWTPPRLHTLYFSDGAEDRAAIHGSVCPHPALIWKVSSGRLYLRAIQAATRPNSTTPLMVAPYWNTNPSTGDVCEGNMSRPQETTIASPATMLEWEEGFFTSRFTHPSGVGVLTTHPGSFIGLWTELLGQTEFPVRYLAPAQQTLQQFAEQDQ
jgi:PRTRC genetic system protein B